MKNMIVSSLCLTVCKEAEFSIGYSQSYSAAVLLCVKVSLSVRLVRMCHSR